MQQTLTTRLSTAELPSQRRSLWQAPFLRNRLAVLSAIILVVIAVMAIAAPLAAYIPLAALAGVLAIVAWNMVEKSAIAVLLRSGWGDAAVLSATFFLTIFRDLTEAIIVGFALGSVLFIHRMSQATAVETDTPFVGEDMADSAQPRGSYDDAIAANPDVVIYRITGAFFFGAAASIASVLDRIQDTHKALIVDFSAVPFLDSTGAHVMEGLARKTARRGVSLFVAGANPDIRRALLTHGVRPPEVHFTASTAEALSRFRAAPPA